MGAEVVVADMLDIIAVRAAMQGCSVVYFNIGKVYDLTGPQSLTMAELAQEFSGALGRTIQYVNVPPQIWEAKLREARLPAHLTAHLITMGQLNRDNRYDRMTDTFQQLVGGPPISAAEFARRHAAAFMPG